MSDWIEDVRAPPWMYLGDIEGLVRELVSNVLDHHGVGQVHRMDLELGDEGCVVVDVHGPGIEVAPMEDGVPFVEPARRAPRSARAGSRGEAEERVSAPDRRSARVFRVLGEMLRVRARRPCW